MRNLLVIAALNLAAFGLLTPSTADAHPPRGYKGGYGMNFGAYYGGGYGGYYGNGGHDFTPHWHQTYTPYGSYSYYGDRKSVV